MSAAQTAQPTISEVYDRVRDEYHLLGMLSYTLDQHDIYVPDLRKQDIDNLRSLLRDVGAAIEGLS